MYGSIVRCVILAAKLHCLCDIWNSQEKGTTRGGDALKYRRQGQHGEGEGGQCKFTLSRYFQNCCSKPPTAKKSGFHFGKVPIIILMEWKPLKTNLHDLSLSERT